MPSSSSEEARTSLICTSTKQMASSVKHHPQYLKMAASTLRQGPKAQPLASGYVLLRQRSAIIMTAAGPGPCSIRALSEQSTLAASPSGSTHIITAPHMCPVHRAMFEGCWLPTLSMLPSLLGDSGVRGSSSSAAPLPPAGGVPGVLAGMLFDLRCRLSRAAVLSPALLGMVGVSKSSCTQYYLLVVRAGGRLYLRGNDL